MYFHSPSSLWKYKWHPSILPDKMLQRYSVHMRIYSWFRKYLPPIGVYGRHRWLISGGGRRQHSDPAAALWWRGAARRRRPEPVGRFAGGGARREGGGRSSRRRARRTTGGEDRAYKPHITKQTKFISHWILVTWLMKTKHALIICTQIYLSWL